MTRPIAFCSDYGLSDEFVGVCHGVIARIAPDARVIDVTHGIPAMNVVAGAATLCSAVPFMPDDAVYLAVVDPGVGSPRAPLVVESANGPILVGPDNGVLSMAWEVLGGAVRAHRIEAEDVLLHPVSHTFHGRDVFAPAAAHLATGRDPATLGSELPVDGLVRVTVARPVVTQGTVRCAVLAIDRFGNVQLSAQEQDLERAGLAGEDHLALDTDEAGAITLERATTFSEVRRGQVALIVDSAGWLEAALNGDNLAEAMRVSVGDPVIITKR